MTTEGAMVKPANKIVVDSKGIHIQTKKVETVALMYPGRLVKKGTNDDDVIVATAASAAYGWLGYEQTSKKYRPTTVDTAYAANDQVAVINGPGIILVAHSESGATITKGTRLKIAANGGVSGGTDGSDHIVAVAEESPGTIPGDVIVRSLI